MDADTGEVRILGEPGERGRLEKRTAIMDRLVAQGMRRGPEFWFAQRLALAARELGSSPEPVFALTVPGRIEVLGKHTDYCGGRSLLAAVERGFVFVAEARKDQRISITDWKLKSRFGAEGTPEKEQIEFGLSPDLMPTAGHWSNYPMTAARRLARDFPGVLCGANIVMTGTLPSAAGMSSSSALITGIFLALAAVNRLDSHPIWRELLATREQIAGYCGCIENGHSFGPLTGDDGVGTCGGSQDHTAILCAIPGHLVQYSFAPIRREAVVPMPAGYTFVIMNSGIAAEKTGEARGKYNAMAMRATALLSLWNCSQSRSDPTIAAALHSSPSAPETFSRMLLNSGAEPELLARFKQFWMESEVLVGNASSALVRGDLAEFSEIVAGSQRAAESMLGNQIPSTVDLVRLARESGAIAASSFGAGFGGSVWAMVETERAGDFAAEWTRKYAEFGGRGRAFVSGAGTPVVWV